MMLITDHLQEIVWKIGETIGEREGRLDSCVAAAGVLPTNINCLEYSAKQFQDVRLCQGLVHMLRG